MEHIEEAGIHSGDSACAIPPFSLSDEIVAELKQQTYALAEALNVRGLMNIQFAVKDGDIYVLEVNPRASRTVPFVSKATGLNLAQAAARVMVGQSLEEQGITAEPVPRYVSVKESVFPFAKFPGVDIVLGPEMRSTGEVMGIDRDFAAAFAKSQIAAYSRLPMQGTVFVSVAARDRQAIVPIAAKLAAMGYTLMCTGGTAAALAGTRDRGHAGPQDPRRPPEPARPPGQRRDRPDREHPQRQGRPHRRGPHPRRRRQPRRPLHHHHRRRQGRRRRAGTAPRGEAGRLCVAGFAQTQSVRRRPDGQSALRCAFPGWTVLAETIRSRKGESIDPRPVQSRERFSRGLCMELFVGSRNRNPLERDTVMAVAHAGTSEVAIFSRILEPDQATLSAAAARAILDLDFRQADKDRMSQLLDKAKKGPLPLTKKSRSITTSVSATCSRS